MINPRVPGSLLGELKELSSESYREYQFAGGETYRVDAPQWLLVKKSGGHTVIDANEVTHYVPSGWIALRWKARDLQNHIDF